MRSIHLWTLVSVLAPTFNVVTATPTPLNLEYCSDFNVAGCCAAFKAAGDCCSYPFSYGCFPGAAAAANKTPAKAPKNTKPQKTTPKKNPT
ncbi:hypothetical protein CTRI78_v006235 [Colletotrichum trifolii]|uniref:Uncharacterized protein n=1 Tax=Colletotrichum trifolii TaxID=5466 RepID=A0A4R8RCW1_COLTR|nr:hypothetical protein CTRI78_v006235 [Colletotrichum trifolii]